MTTATRSVAVVATRLPTIDRRALSQAWFSALHVAQPAGRRVPAHSPSQPVTPTAADRHAKAGGKPQPPHAAGFSERAVRTRPAAGAPPALERRSPAGDLARRIERAVSRNVARGPVRTPAIAIDAGDGRVHILVRTDGATTRIVALCAPHLRERVDRALAHARFALAATGLRLEVTP